MLLKTLTLRITTIVISLFISFLGIDGFAQGNTSDGTDFYVGYVAPSYNKVANPATLGFYGAYVLLSSYSDNVVTISYFDITTGLEDPGSSVVIKARQGTSVPLNLGKMLLDSANKAQYRACHITAKHPIHAEFFSTGACAGGSFLVLPTIGLGKKYVVSSWHDNIDGTNGLVGGFYGPSALEVAGGFFHITAAFDSTTVTIKQSPYPGDTLPYVSVVQLNRGQCYEVRSRCALNSDDISGSVIESTKPIAVIAGHENAALGGLNGINMEGRNMMVQQMTPVEYWDDKDILSLPLKESSPFDTTHSGAGDLYRVVVYDSSGANIHANYTPAGEVQFSTAGFGTADLDNVWNPVNFHSDGGKKFNVMQIDKADQNTSAPFPRPAMMTLVPKSKWRTSFVWYVPNNRFETLQTYYVNLIAPKGDFDSAIKSSFNGGPIRPIKQVLIPEQTFQIPGRPELLGTRFKLSPGSYYSTSSHPFIVYNCGNRGLDPDFNLGDFDGDDFFFSYGSPAGMNLGGGTANMTVKVDTLCSFWKICVTDNSNKAIRSVVLLDDPGGDILKHPAPNPPYGYAYSNATLSDGVDPAYSNEIVFPGSDTSVCFEADVQNIFKNGYAPILISDEEGNSKLIELRYGAPIVSLAPDSGEFTNILLQNDTCQRFVFKNESPSGVQALNMLSADLLVGKYFWISGTVPQLPASIKAGDSLIVRACFAPKDTNTHVDTLVFITDCGISRVPLIGSGAIPIIVADDHNFGSVLVGTTKCDTVRVRNIGKAPLQLTKDWLLHNSTTFSFPDSTRLPLWLDPGESVLLTICYTPHAVQTDTTILNWGTNEKDPYAHANKDTSILRGAGIQPGVRWDRALQYFHADSTKETVVRMYLFNNFTAPILVTSVFIEGKDSAEFRVVANQFGTTTLTNFQMYPGDSIWVDVGFMPDMTKPLAERYAARSADLVATSKSDTEQVVQLIGSFSADKVKETSSVKHVLIRPNPSSGAYISVTIELEKPERISVAVFDVLGREVRTLGAKNFDEGSSQFLLPVLGLSPGSYYLRIQTGGGIIAQKFEIIQ
jgi:hypothetical protein